MNKIFKSIKENYRLVTGSVVAGLLLGWILFHNSDAAVVNDHQEITGETHIHSEDNPEIWTCSMHPQIKQDKPGQCPICAMDLIPLTTMNTGGNVMFEGEIVMSDEAISLASIQTSKVTSEMALKRLYLQGKVQADERNIAELTARYGGRIENLYVNFTGQNVKRGEKLATIYSPDLVTAQKELLEALASSETRPSLYTSAKAKLKLWNLTDDQISAIEKNGEPQLYFDVLSPISGTVTMRHVATGDYIKEGTALFRVIDLTRVWVMFNAYESDLPWIKSGDRVNFTVQALPGTDFSSVVTFIDPLIDAKTRVAKVRVELANKGLKLKPEMFTSGFLESTIAVKDGQVIIPRSSVLWTGKRAIVYVKVPGRENPSFIYREVVLGPRAGEYYVVAEGLEEGEEVVTNGVFKVDASAQLMGQPSMMNPSGGASATMHDHANMTAGSGKSAGKAGDFPLTAIPLEFRQQLTQFYNAYLIMKDAFVESDPVKVSNSTALVLERLAKSDMKLLEGESHRVWMTLSDNMDILLKDIRAEKDIESQRKFFTDLNSHLYEVVTKFGLEETTAFYEFCPMANDDKGGYWFSNSQEIRNPYFGDMMLTCGEVVETIQYER